MILQLLTVLLSVKPLLPDYDIHEIYFTLSQWYLELLSPASEMSCHGDGAPITILWLWCLVFPVLLIESHGNCLPKRGHKFLKFLRICRDM